VRSSRSDARASSSSVGVSRPLGVIVEDNSVKSRKFLDDHEGRRVYPSLEPMAPIPPD